MEATNAIGKGPASTAIMATPAVPLTFDTSTIPAPNSAYTFNVSRTVSITLPPATDGIGTGDLTYTLDGPIPAGLRFDDDARTLTGIPSTTATAVTLTYMVTDSADTPITAELTFTVTVLSGAFITTWQISPGSVANRTITIPIHEDSNYEYTVDWGDDSDNTEIYTNTIPATHTYTNAGNFKVTITGIFPRIYFNNGVDTNKIISIDQWGNNRWDSMENAFRGCSKLRYTAKDTPDLSQVTDMSRMFSRASVFNGNIGDWEVDNVTSMDQDMFSGASLFNGNIGDWEVGNVTNMGQMFSGASAFNQNISEWEVGNVTDMGSMFYQASAFNQNIGGWDVSKITSMSANLERLPHLTATSAIGLWIMLPI